MIARPLPAPVIRERGGRGRRSARTASLARRARNRRLRYRSVGRIISTLSGLTIAVLVYLALLANVTRLHYEIGRVQHERARLADRVLRNDDEIAQLASPERLAVFAQRLGLREPRAFAVVEMPRPRQRAAPPPRGVAALLPVVVNFVGAK